MQTTTSAVSHNNLFETKEEYLAFVRRWKELAHAKLLTREDCLLRCLLLRQDVAKAFPITKNELRLKNGAKMTCGLRLARDRVGGVSPVLDYQKLQEKKAHWLERGREIPEYLTTVSWAERWVNPMKQDSLERGISCVMLHRAQVLLSQLELP